MLTIELVKLQEAVAPNPDIRVRGRFQRVLGVEATAGELHLRVVEHDQGELRRYRFCVLPDGAELPAAWRTYLGTVTQTGTGERFSVFEGAP